ncbi:hypothetical protein [Corynebacterium glutamicum]|uniref:hypothetical protein n=1 Tax=Corynebacterium glutamicum TaxID=1718 RepID=UPI00117D6740|nr:hypothetical protein [Corynebacterium glutamicum]QDQ19964.1 hypothetical protein FOL53_03725 [Corynebacterium glutamicum]QDQ23531.1 hypothetical protein FOY32_08355 [Corynebacterium glutamicum]
MATPSLPRHRGTWSTIAVILIFALGVCTVVFGIFNLATEVLFGLSTIALGIGLILPGVWWLRWYQKPRMLRGFIPLSLVLLVPGVVGLAMSAGGGNTASDNEPVIASSTPSTTETISSSPSSSATPTTSTEPTLSSSLVETTEPAVPEATTPDPVPPVMVAPIPEVVPPPISSFVPEPVIPPMVPPTAPAPVEPEESVEPEQSGPETSEPPVEETLEPEQPAPAPNNPWQDLINQFIP